MPNDHPHEWVLVSEEFYDEPYPTTYRWYACGFIDCQETHSETEMG